jgi:hypothetical protein
MEYYLHDGQEQHGPFTLEELRNQPLFKPDTLVWHEGMDDWTKAKQVEALKEFLKPVPPPISKPPVIKPEKEKIDSKLEPGQSSASSWKTLIIFVLIVVLAYAGYAIYNKQQKAGYEEERVSREENLKKQVRDNIRSYVHAGNSAYQISVLGGINGLSIEVANQTDYLLDNVRVVIRYIKANGETWKEEPLDFALISPNNKMTLRAPDSDRGTSIASVLK